MARVYKTVTHYLITVIDLKNFTKQIYSDEEIRKWLICDSDIKDNHFWKLLNWKYIIFECDEDYEILGLPTPDRWDEYYGL